LAESVSILEICLGPMHPQTGDAYSKIAIAYVENGHFQAASPWMRRSFCVFSSAFGLDDELTQSAYHHMCKVEKALDSGLDKVPI
jgi:hypothetical protein